ncbi:MAG: EscU/YscU/HrcU family type III secretion system export apparatus switch protein [Deltaproteobacteria bacterium]|nr:EscU/YscU/HrcU family type III secretion system export apparatus switch protein [Deltaproteobacteria bacterium]MCB9489005.1 EscU/YscU/HrcU family type III secretion system export apparatus switch protein [Deltaproteobacteria bacterium]
MSRRDDKVSTTDAARTEAAALRYDDQKDDAPRLVAKGKGRVADRILALAREHGVPIHVDTDLTHLLGKLKTDAPIPRDLYKAVAEVLALLYRANRQAPTRR